MLVDTFTPDTTIWKIERDGQFVACGSAVDYEQAWMYAMEASNRFIDWSDNPTDDECDIAMLAPVNPTVRDIRDFTFSTGPVS